MTSRIQPHKEYAKYYLRWKKMRDILDGEDCLKTNDLAAFNGNNLSKVNFSTSTIMN